jgi:hypothetical protein
MSPPVRGPIDVLAILSGEQDQAQLANAPGKWRLRFVRSYEDSQAILRERTAKVIVTDYRIASVLTAVCSGVPRDACACAGL